MAQNPCNQPERLEYCFTYFWLGYRYFETILIMARLPSKPMGELYSFLAFLFCPGENIENFVSWRLENGDINLYALGVFL